MKLSTVMLILSIMYTVSYSQHCMDLRGQWQNETGSILQIDSISIDGNIGGVYKSATGVDGKTFSLLGWTNINPEISSEINISFSVR